MRLKTMLLGGVWRCCEGGCASIKAASITLYNGNKVPYSTLKAATRLGGGKIISSGAPTPTK